MRGSSALRTSVAPGGALVGPWARNPLWTRARAVPSLDLCFADTKSLVCATTGQNLVSHTRASSGTFVGSDGVLRTAVTNLLLRSEEFDNAYWGRVRIAAFGSGSVADAIAAPNGTITADLVTQASGQTNAGVITIGSWSLTPSAFSVFAKAGGKSRISLLTDTSGNSETWFNLANGTVGTKGSNHTASIINVGDGWYRCSVVSSATTTFSSIYLADTDGSRTVTDSGGIYLWGAQLEQSSTVGEYIPTTSTINSAPRFDHNPTTGESLGLLVEEARTNSIRNNTMVGAVAGTPGTVPTNWTLAQNGITGLSFSVVSVGTENGIAYTDFRINGTPSGSIPQGVQLLLDTSTGISASASQTWTESVYYKLSAGSLANIPNFRINIQQYNAGVFVQSNSTIVTAPSATLTRVSGTTTLSASTTTHALPLLALETIGGAPIDITLRIGLPQLEQGAFATSPILTSSATVTRAADVASIAGANFGVTRTNLLARSEDFENAYWNLLSNVSVSPNAETAPNGTLTAEKLTETAVNNVHYIARNNVSIPAAGIQLSLSVYAKAAERNFTGLQLTDGTNYIYCTFNLQTGVASTPVNNGTGSGASASIQSVGNGWYRCTLSGIYASSGTTVVPAFYAGNSNVNLATSGYLGVTGSGIYLWGAQLEVGSAATPYIPSPSVFTSRASSATYVGGDGLIKTATTNLLLRSEEFNDASWSKVNTTVTANSIAAPNGTVTADTITDSNDVSAAIHSVTSQNQSFTSGLSYTVSVYARAGTQPGVAFVLPAAAFTSNLTVAFNISTGSIVSFDSGMTASITAVGNGWYRCTATATATATASSSTAIQFRIATASTSFYQGNGTGTISIWGTQLEQSSTVGEYIPTTSSINSAARYDHDPVSLIGKGLLLEGASTNLFLNSEDFSNPTWTAGAITVTANAATAPTGATTADSLLETSANTEHLIYNTTPITFTTATQSVYVKPNGRTNVALRFYYDSNDWVARVFSLTGSGSVTQSSAGSSSGFSAVSHSIVNAGNGWYRISMTATQTSRSVYVASPDLCTSSTPTLATVNGSEVYAGDVTKGVYVWGAQLETTSTASSYIPTTASTVTRAADVSTSTATSVFESSWYRQDEGTAFTQYSGQAGGRAFMADDGTGNNRFEVRITSNTSQLNSWSGGTQDVTSLFAPAATGLVDGVVVKTAIGLKVNDAAISTNGFAVGTDTSCAMPIALNRMILGSFQGSATFLNGTIRRLTYFPTRLGNEVLQRITQP
jgi:hypothetical protein